MTRQANALLIIMVSFLFAHWLRFGYTALPQPYLMALLISMAVSAIVLPATGAFRRDFEWMVLRRMRRLIAGWAVVVLMLVSLAAMLKVSDVYSRIWFGLWVMLASVGLVIILLLTHMIAIRHRNVSRRTHGVVLVGAGEAARLVEHQITKDPSSDMDLLARFGEAWSEEQVLPIGDLSRFVDEHKVQAVWIAIPWENRTLLDQSLDALKESVVSVHVVPDMHQYRLLNQGVSEWGGLPVISLAGTPLTGTEARLKGALDWFGSLLLCLVLSPLLFLIAIIIRLTSKGPVLFRQLRHGVGGESINIYKFRTMKQHQEEAGQVTQAANWDSRVTGIGRFLRKSSLDELPQLFNVLKGEMSLVGPRPHALEHNDLFKSRIPRYMLRHKVKPGITGWAQVNGFRGLTDTKEKMAMRIEHDLWYIQNWSLWLDLKILMMTPLVMIHRNAY